MIPSSIKCIIERTLKKKKRKYNPDLRKFALTLHYYSPKAYNFVRSQFDNLLPHPDSIRKWYNVINGDPGFTKEAFNAIEERCQVKDVVNIAIDEMSIRQLVEWDGKKYQGFVDIGTDISSDEELQSFGGPKAKYALVFLAVSLNDHWKVPLAYFLISKLTGSERASLLEKCLYLLHATGAKTYSITFDGAPVNIAMCTALGACYDYENNFKPWFPHPITNEEVYTFWDACHMLKLCRNTFGEKRILIDGEGGKIDWKFIDNLVKIQQKQGLNAATKLTSRHVEFNNEKMKVKLAAQVLSVSVSHALTFCERKVKDDDFVNSSATAKFCLMLNNCFDILNGRNAFAKYK